MRGGADSGSGGTLFSQTDVEGQKDLRQRRHHGPSFYTGWLVTLPVMATGAGQAVRGGGKVSSFILKMFARRGSLGAQRMHPGGRWDERRMPTAAQ